MKLRIEGLPGEVDAFAAFLRTRVAVVEESHDYPNRGASRLVRRYVEIRGEPPTDHSPTRPARITRASTFD